MVLGLSMSAPYSSSVDDNPSEKSISFGVTFRDEEPPNLIWGIHGSNVLLISLSGSPHTHNRIVSGSPSWCVFLGSSTDSSWSA